MATHGVLVYSTGYLLVTNINYFDAQIIPFMGSGSPFKPALILQARLPRFLSTSLLSATECSRLTLYFLCFSPGVSHFSKEPWFIFVENGFQKLHRAHLGL